ncbi:MAG: ThiF family adenylyltransferase [Rubrivivax sp.]
MSPALTPEEFYARRDHRTNLYVGGGGYVNKTVLLTGDPVVLGTYVGQLIASVSANMLGRWCRRVKVLMPNIQMHPLLGTGPLVGHLLAQMRGADPFGTFEVVQQLDDHDLMLLVGADVAPGLALPASTTLVSASGWTAAVRRAGDGGLAVDSQDHNPVGAAAAAILGGAQIFRDALGLPGIFEPGFLFDAFLGAAVAAPSPQRPFPDGVDLGRVLMTGAGAVGSSAAFFMDAFGVKAQLTCVDADEFKVENLARTALFRYAHCGLKKVLALARALAASASIKVTPVDAWWHDTDQNLGAYDIVLPVANEYGVRQGLQSALPPLMIHASTGNNWNVTFGRHIPGRDDCFAERFAGVDKAPKPGCSGGQLPQSEPDAPDASLPFLSFWAGFVTAVDLVRLGMPGYPQVPNHGLYSFRKGTFLPQLFAKTAKPSCDCNRQGVVFAKLRASTRFRALSPAGW